MADTKEKILNTALRLFARNGYSAVSVSSIAEELGMTKGALYRHYASKRDILDSIVARMVQLDLERARRHRVPEATFDESPDEYRKASAEGIRDFTESQFGFWTEDEFGRDFRKVLTLEQYGDPEMADLHEKCLTSGPVSYMEDLFREMMAQGICPTGDPRQLAVEFYAPFYLLLSLSDAGYGKEAASILSKHIEGFMEAHAVLRKDRGNDLKGNEGNG